MKTFFDCIPCLIRQAIDSLRLAGADEPTHEHVLREVLEAAARMDFGQPPAAMAQRVHRRIRELTGKPDPYLDAKARLNATALKLYPAFQQRLRLAPKPMELAVRLAIAANMMDLGVKTSLDDSQVCSALADSVAEPLQGDVDEFCRHAAEADRILYLTDNAGEIVFDRLLIEQMAVEKVTLAVKGGPVLNDATREDAEATGLADLVEVIDNGSDAPGTILDDCSPSFREHFDRADLIIAKGQGNYETLSESPRPIYFLLRVKCPIIARDLKCPIGTMVIRRSQPGTAVPAGSRGGPAERAGQRAPRGTAPYAHESRNRTRSKS